MIIFTSFSRVGEKGLSVSQMRGLRKNLKNQNAEYIVAKKNLIRVSAERSGVSKLIDVGDFEGSLGLVLGGKEGDSIALSKEVCNFSKTNQALRVLGAVLEKQYIDADKLVELAKFNSKETLVAGLFGMMQYPIKNLLVLLSNIKK